MPAPRGAAQQLTRQKKQASAPTGGGGWGACSCGACIRTSTPQAGEKSRQASIRKRAGAPRARQHEGCTQVNVWASGAGSCSWRAPCWDSKRFCSWTGGRVDGARRHARKGAAGGPRRSVRKTVVGGLLSSAQRSDTLEAQRSLTIAVAALQEEISSTVCVALQTRDLAVYLEGGALSKGVWRKAPAVGTQLAGVPRSQLSATV